MANRILPTEQCLSVPQSQLFLYSAAETDDFAVGIVSCPWGISAACCARGSLRHEGPVGLRFLAASDLRDQLEEEVS